GVRADQGAGGGILARPRRRRLRPAGPALRHVRPRPEARRDRRRPARHRGGGLGDAGQVAPGRRHLRRTRGGAPGRTRGRACAARRGHLLMSEQTKPGQFLNEAPINTTNLLFDDEARPDNELIDENADYRNEYYQETNFLYSNIGKPQAADGDDPADPGILTGTLHGDVYETYQLFASGDQLAAVVKGFGVASTVTDLFEAVASGNYLDPFSWLGGQVMSWMLEHVEPMRKTLEAIAGSPDIVAAYSTSWENIATELDEVAAGWAQAVVTGTAEWIGETADAYRAA